MSKGLREGNRKHPRQVGHYRPGAVEFAGDFQPEESLLSFAAFENHPALWHLQEQYKRIRLYREWTLGPSTAVRRSQSAHDRPDFLADDGANLALVLSHFRGESKRRLLAALQELFDGIVDIACPVTSGSVSLFLEEGGGRQIPASRLSDGTLRYLCLLAILLHDEPPPLVAIEEPELGIHPDVIAKIAELLVDASRRTQLVVTTHSRMLVDALSDHPSSVVVCEKEDGESRLVRLDGHRLKAWLDEYSLGDLWGSGELGGNRWSSAVVYIEGGGDRNENLERLFRRSWTKFFGAEGLRGRLPRVVRGGSRNRTIKLFLKAVSAPDPGRVPLLLVDSEGPVQEGRSVWQHLRAREKRSLLAKPATIGHF